MNEHETNENPEQEISAIGAVYKALNGISPKAQKRILDYVTKMLNIATEVKISAKSEVEEVPEIKATEKANQPIIEETENTDGAIEGISPVAHKWMRRNGLHAADLSSIFSLGVDDIDLVAKNVPGKSKRARMLNVLLLKGIAAYLSSGAPRITHQQAKETCTHYDAYDSPNFSKCLRDFATDISGTKETGYTLNARGLTNATDLIKEMTGGEKEK